MGNPPFCHLCLGGVCPESPGLRTRFPQPPTPGPMASPEQLSFRERQKYFELEVRVPQAEGPPKRVSLVGADDLRKMQEEEGRWPAVQAGRAREGGAGPGSHLTPHPSAEAAAEEGTVAAGGRGQRAHPGPGRGGPRGATALGRPCRRVRDAPHVSRDGGGGGTAQGSLCQRHPTHLVLLPRLLSQAQPPVPPAPRRRRRPGAHGQSRAAPSGAAARSEPGAVGACARSGSVPCRAAGPGGREARAVEGSQVRPCWPSEAFPALAATPAHLPSTASPSPTG